MWLAVMSKPQREVAAVEALTARNVDAFTPMAKRYSRERIGTKRTRKLVEIPMFRGYLFVQSDTIPWQVFRACHETVRGVVSVAGLPVEIPAHQIEAVRALEATAQVERWGDEAVTLPEVGQLVEIVSGPFAGQTTRVDALTLGRVVALLDTLGGKVTAKIPTNMVKVA